MSKQGKVPVTFQRGTPVWIHWEDSSTDIGWKPPGHQVDTEKILSIGMVLHDERPKAITLTTSISETGPALNPLTIPGTAILKIGQMKEEE